MNLSKFAIIISVCLFLTSCSWISGQRSLFDENGEYVDQSVQTIPKAQYDQLLEKYETLLKDSSSTGQGSVAVSPMPEKDELLSALSKAQGEPELAETVDVFAVQPQTSSQNRVTPTPAPVATRASSKVDIEGEITILRRAESFLVQNQLDNSMNEIRKVENSSVRQIRVRAKYLLGELLISQNEYDLAMQVFKEILAKDAFSGVVYKTLGRLILCAEKLQLEQEKERYYSMLHEIFEA